MSSSGELPVGTATFLFTDIEGSTLLERELREQYAEVLAEHRRLLREAFANNGGSEIDTQGDSFFFVFSRARHAVSAAVEAQLALAGHTWPEGHTVRVRIGMHTGEASLDDGRYVGLAVHRGARISAVGHGGQILLSSATRDVVEDDLPADQRVVDLGEHRLKDLPRPERIFQLVAPGLPEDFPPLKTAAATPFEGRERELAEAATEELAARWRRPGRGKLIAATAAAAAIGVAVGLLATQGGGVDAQASVAGNAVGVVDSNGKIVSEVAVGESPNEVAATEDAIWVTNATDDTVSRIDPSTNGVRQTIDVGGGPAGVAVGGGSVWVANGLDGTVSRIEAVENREVQKITVGNGPAGVAFGLGAVWAANSVDGTVSRIEPSSGRVTASYPAVVGASAIAVDFGRVWIASPSTATVVALDPKSGETVARIGVGVEPAGIATGADAVWVANRADGTVSKISPQADAVTSTIRVGRGPEGIAVTEDAVWVANGRDGTLSRIDPRTGSVAQTVALANPPRGLALSAESVYVAVRSTGAEHRGGELRVQAGIPPGGIDPALAYDSTTWAALIMTNNGLVAFRKVAGVEGTQLVPDLAVALPTPSDRGTSYTFVLRPGIAYSTGALVQPRDFRRALERVFELGSAVTGYYAGFVGAAACRKGKRCNLSRGIVTDEAARTVTFRLTAPDPDFLAKLALPFAFAVPAGTAIRENRISSLPATGPYRIGAFDARAGTLRLVRNPRFEEWSSDAQPEGFPDSIVFKGSLGLGDVEAGFRAVEKGDADLVPGGGPPLPEQRLDELAVRYPSRLYVSPALTTIYFFLSTRVPPFSDRRARRAVSIAWDATAVAAAIGRAGTPTCRILPRNFPGYRPTCPGGQGGAVALDAARELVRSSGTRRARVAVWLPPGTPPRLRIYVVSLLQSLGYRVRPRIVGDIDAYFTAVADPKTRAQIGFGGWSLDFPSAEGFIRPLLSCAADDTTNLSGFCDRGIDAQMNNATATQARDPVAGTRLWQDVENAILARAPIVPAFNRSYISLVSPRVGNYQYNPQWGVLLSQLWVK